MQSVIPQFETWSLRVIAGATLVAARPGRGFGRFPLDNMQPTSRDRAQRRAAPMSTRNDSRSLLATFDSLAKAHTRPWIGAPRVPFLVIGLIVLLIAGLFVALVIEERNVKREAMSRDIDAAARQLGLRLDALGESLSTLAFDLNDARNEAERFREQAMELLASRRELSRVQYVDPGGNVLAQVDAIPSAGALSPLERALATR